MQVILLDKLSQLGSFGEIVKVKAGYARNFLIPRGKAVPATKNNIKHFDERRVLLEKERTKILIDAQYRAKKIDALGSITITAKTGKGGKLFGSIGTKNIVNAINKTGISINKSEVRLPNGIIRTIGEYEIYFQLHSEVCCKTIVRIISE